MELTTQTIKARLIASASLFTLSIVSLTNTAVAQDFADDDVVVVTGSRITTDSSITAPSPVQSLTIDNFVRSGDIELATGLRNIPALTGSDPASLDSAGGFDALGISTLDLRSLGAVRTLVLQDGRRHVPGVGGSQAVDIGIITRDGRDFDGIEYRLQGGISDEGDSEEVFASIAGGSEFSGGKGSAVVALEFNHSTSIVNSDRPNIAGSGFSSLNGSNAFLNGVLGLDPDSENAFVPNRTLPVSSAGTTIALDPTPFAFPFGALLDSFDADGNFNPETDSIPLIAGTDIPTLQVIDPVTGQVRAFNPGIATGAFNAIGGDGIPIGQTAPGLTLIPEFSRFNVATAVDYEVNNHLEFFIDGKASYSETVSVGLIPDQHPVFLPHEIFSALKLIRV